MLTSFRYGPFTLVAATFFGLAAYSSARTSLKELVPWLPLAVCLFVLLTVTLFPKLRQSLSGDNGTQIAMEEGRLPGFYGSLVEPGSVQSEEDTNIHQWNPDVEIWLEHDISYTGGADRLTSPGRLSHRGSDIDLDDRQSVARFVAKRMVSPSRQAYNINSLSQITPDNGFPTQRFAATGLGSRLDQPRAPCQRSSSPESILVECPSSTSAASEMALLG